MEWTLNEILFYGGIAITILSGLATIIFGLLSKLSKTKLLSQMEKEYGESPPSLKEHK